MHRAHLFLCGKEIVFGVIIPADLRYGACGGRNRHMSLRKKLVIFVLAVSVFFVWYAVFAESRDGLMVYFFDVGQGDSIFIEAENGNQILIDGGPGDAVLAELGKAMPFYDRSIDMLVLTHPDADHLNGLVEVIARYKPGVILETGVSHSTAPYAEWRTHIDTLDIPVVHAVAGQKFLVADGVTLEVLSPFRVMAGEEPKDINDTAIVLRLDYGEMSFLFTGDIESKTERVLSILMGGAIDTDILKVAHHGSKTSSIEEFLKRVTPEAAVISVGRNNRYGHPHPEVLERFEESHIPIHRTDISGTVILHAYPDGSYTFQ